MLAVTFSQLPSDFESTYEDPLNPDRSAIGAGPKKMKSIVDDGATSPVSLEISICCGYGAAVRDAN